MLQIYAYTIWASGNLQSNIRKIALDTRDYLNMINPSYDKNVIEKLFKLHFFSNPGGYCERYKHNFIITLSCLLSDRCI